LELLSMKSITTKYIFPFCARFTSSWWELSQEPKSSKSLPPLAMSPCELNLRHTISNIITTSVACAIGPSVNLFPNYLNLSFEILLNFQWQNLFKIQYLMHLGSIDCKITYKILIIKKFPTMPRVGPNFLQKISFYLLNLQSQNYSIFNNSCSIGLNITKQPSGTPTHWGLSNNTKSAIRGVMVWEMSMW
jgi:hypothetical protein